MTKVPTIDVSLPISEDLATIFRKEFDNDQVAEKLVSRETENVDFEQWKYAQDCYENFRMGLRNCRIELHTTEPAIFVFAILFLNIYTEQGETPKINQLADMYLDRENLEELKAQLRSECTDLHAQLHPLWLRVDAWRISQNWA